jgi:class 3 adenylate cyclase
MSDTVNVAARVEQLTKTTGDTMLLTPHPEVR